jgi:hypothetical protein
MLNARPQLETLHLVRRYDELYDTNAPRRVLQSHAMLPRLSRPSFRERDDILYRLMTLSSHIDAPPTLCRHIYMYLFPGWEWNANIFTTMQTLVPHNSAPGVDDGGLRVAQVAGGLASGTFEVRSRTYSESAHAHPSAFARENALFLLRIEWSRIYDRSSDERCRFFRIAKLCGHLCIARIEDLTTGPDITDRGMSDVLDAPVVVVQWQALLFALPGVKTLRLHRGGFASLSLLRALSASASLLPLLQTVFVVQSAVRYASASTAGIGNVNTGAAAGSAIVSYKSVKVPIGAELVGALNGRSGLEVVLVGCEVDEEALEALGKQARVEIGDECVYMQEYM